jgi:pyrroline-5-carboxylate reductase
MPNTPVQVGEGIIAFTNETDFNEEERDFAVRLFAPVAQVEWINEAQLAALAALAGSGPAYAALFAEALADGAVKEGLPRELSLRLAAKTLWGTGKLLFQGGRHPAVLKDAVCSPGGTSIEGIAALEGRAFRSALIEAVSAAASKFERLFPLNTNPDSK